MTESFATIKNTLGRNERVKSRKVIEALFKGGKAITVPPIRLLYLPLTDHPPGVKVNLQAAFSVSKRNFKNAADRNRIKRLLRETYRITNNPLRELLAAQDRSLAIFLIFTARELPDYEPLKERMTEALTMLKRKLEQQPR